VTTPRRDLSSGTGVWVRRPARGWCAECPDDVGTAGNIHELLRRSVYWETGRMFIPIVATTLLVVPCLWVLTRWSLFAPVISREHLGPVAALKRSSELVRNHFELVFLTAAFATVLEEVAIHAGAAVGLLVSGSDTWGQWLGGPIATSLFMPLAAFATSVAYMYLATGGKSLE